MKSSNELIEINRAVARLVEVMPGIDAGKLASVVAAAPTCVMNSKVDRSPIVASWWSSLRDRSTSCTYWMSRADEADARRWIPHFVPGCLIPVTSVVKRVAIGDYEGVPGTFFARPEEPRPSYDL